jgi:DNA-binding NarL/FixJ family response regulator
VLVAERNDLFRRGARIALEQDRCEIVGEASAGAQAVALASRIRPDVVLLDSGLPDLSAPAATRRMAEVAPGCSVVVLSRHADEDAVLAALAAGACGYLSRYASDDQLLDAVHCAHRGEGTISAEIASKLAWRLQSELRDQLATSKFDAVLSKREAMVLCLLSKGLENAAIAGRLSLSPATVKRHVSNILTKLGLQNRVQAAIYGVLSGDRAASDV